MEGGGAVVFFIIYEKFCMTPPSNFPLSAPSDQYIYLKKASSAFNFWDSSPPFKLENFRMAPQKPPPPPHP